MVRCRLLLRSNMEKPNSRSSSCTWRLTEGWETYSSSAALEKLMDSATLRKYCTCNDVMPCPAFLFFSILPYL